MDDFLQEAHDNENTNFCTNRSLSFSRRVGRHQQMLQVVQTPAKETQTRVHTLLDCRGDLDMLTHDARESNEVPGRVLHGCKLGTKHTGSTSLKLPSLSFTSGVINIQNNDIRMTGFVEMACSGFCVDDEAQVGQRSDSSSSDNIARQESREFLKKSRTGKQACA